MELAGRLRTYKSRWGWLGAYGHTNLDGAGWALTLLLSFTVDTGRLKEPAIFFELVETP